ncbi:hypothetical protein [uncultured Hymenobacter sp.]|uniref:hypothetical protein n=1 Tax=uncultured Hymenobacter sp. TaxID=170016 RepID=UPI0035CB7597
MTSKLTSQVVAFKEIPDFKTDIFVDWALEMMVLGYESEALYTLAGLKKPALFYETISYVKEALKDLGINIKEGEEAILSYSSYFIKKIATGEDVKENLARVYRYCRDHNYESCVYDFYLLWWAWDDLDYGNEHQYYWPEANGKDIADVVVEQAKKWLMENRLHLSE